MPSTTSAATRFRDLRERAGLSRDEAAKRMGITSSAVWDIEAADSDLTCCYSPRQVAQFARVLGIGPAGFFGEEISLPPISASELVRLIHEQCRLREITLLEFEEIVGWRLSASMEPPDRLLQDITVDGLRWLCRELGIEWQRALASS
jgi:transcriptional regulator with XRE-family HTH domain